MPSSRESHCGRVGNGVLGKQCLDIRCEGVRRIDGVEPISNVAEMRIEFVGRELTICNPSVRESAWKVRLYHNVSIPKTAVVGADVADYGNTA